jgi:hypothetical protein
VFVVYGIPIRQVFSMVVLRFGVVSELFSARALKPGVVPLVVLPYLASIAG